VNLYAESSAVLAWLLTEKEGSRVQQLLNGVEVATSSDLTLIECDRAIIRLAALGQISETEAIDLRRELAFAANRWQMFHIGREIADRARRSFPVEPVRSLDAIHLATALAAGSVVPNLEILSLDERIRNSARELGFRLQPR
jgi:predicted nucleic acid-binding protein